MKKTKMASHFSPSRGDFDAEGRIDISPLPTPRLRAVCRGRFPTLYFPKNYKSYYDQLVEEIKSLNLPFFDYPIDVFCDFTIQKPKTSKLLYPKGDVDNYVKGLLDAFQKAGVIANDNLVVILGCGKRWGQRGISFGISRHNEEN